MFLKGKQILRLIILVVALAAIWFGVNSLNSLLKSEVSLENSFDVPLFTEELTGVHSMVADKLGHFWVSQPEEGIVSLVEINESGEISSITQIFSELNRPTKLVIEPKNKLTLFVIEKDKISYARLYTEDILHEIIKIPESLSFTDISFTKEGSLLVVEESKGEIYKLDENLGYNDFRSADN